MEWTHTQCIRGPHVLWSSEAHNSCLASERPGIPIVVGSKRLAVSSGQLRNPEEAGSDNRERTSQQQER